MTRDEVQTQALDALIKNKGGTVVLDTGTGKTKVAIDFMLQSGIREVLILVPRINLKQTWIDELAKWGIKPFNTNSLFCYYYMKGTNTQVIDIHIETIQGIYKSDLMLGELLIIADEFHVMASEAYKAFFYNHRQYTVVGLTATPEDNKPEKAVFYKEIAPIVYRFKEAAENGIINDRKYFVLRTDLCKSKTTIPNWNYPISEFEVLEYYNRRVKETGEDIQRYFDENYIFNGNYFSSASTWCWQNKGTPAQKKLGWPYLKSVADRKAFMLNQNTTADLTKDLVYNREGAWVKQPYGGTLVFSNQISQVQKILEDEFIVHSKKKKEENNKIIFGFNEKVFPVIGSCEALEMGMNFKRAKIAIFESYIGSPTKASQKMGRTDRLPLDESAIIIILYVNNSPCDGWYRKSGFPDLTDPAVQVFDNLPDLRKAIKEYV